MAHGEVAAALEALEAVLIAIIEDAHELAVASTPDTIEAHRKRIAALRQVGTDIAVLADACDVMLRRAD